MKICLYGSASDEIADVYKTAVHKLAKLLAKSGHELVFGGGCTGLMGSAAQGMTENNGKIIGVAPNFFKEGEVKVLFDGCQILSCNTMYERKQIMEEISDGFIVVPGGIGTYDEFFGVTATKQLKRHSKPIAVYNVEGFFDNLSALIKDGKDKGFIKEYESLFYISDNPFDIIKYLETNR